MVDKNMEMEGNRQSGKQWKGKGGEEVDKQIVGQGIGSDTHTHLTRFDALLVTCVIGQLRHRQPITLSMKNARVLIDFLQYQQVRLRLSED